MGNIIRILIVSILLFIVPNNLFAYDVEIDGIYYDLNSSSKTASVTYKTTSYNSYSGNVKIPENITTNSITYNVTSIGNNAFSGCSGLTSLTLPSALTSIGSYAFSGCRGLTSLDIPASVTSIGDYAFHGCTGFTSWTIPGSGPEYPTTAFYGCSGLKSVTFHCKTVKSWFQDLYNITSVTMGSEVTSIGGSAFSGLSKLTSVDIPSGVTSIGNNAFSGCSGLTSLTLPSVLTSIGSYAFSGCRSLSLVISNIVNPFSIQESVFEGIPSTSVLQVPIGTKSNYLNYSGWTKHFGYVSEGGEINVYNLTIKASGNGSAIYGSTTIKNDTKSFSISEGASVTISFSAESGYRIKWVKLNNTDITSLVTNNQYTINSINDNTTIEVDFEQIPPTYILSIKAIGNGSASYSGETIRGKTKSYTVNEGTSVTITFTPDDGYRIKSLKVNNTAVTVSSSYSATINADTSIEVVFEEIPATTYTLSIKATGNGSASYSGESIRGKTKTYTVNEGTSVTITFTPDDGYRIKSLKVNGSSVTANTSYKTTINADTSIEVVFEAIPATTYTLSIKATGNGSATYSGETIRDKTKSYTVNEGTSVTISFTPDTGYRIKSLKVNGSSVTANTSYKTTINADTSIEVVFEEIPATTYTLSIKATGNGSASYSGETIRDKTKSYTVNEGTSITITFTPDDGYRIKSLRVNGTSVTASSSYTTTINADTSIEVEFEDIPDTPTTYSLTIRATGNGSALYGGETIRNTKKSYTVDEGTNVTITFSPDDGYRIKSLKVNNVDATVSDSYTTKVNADTKVEVEFEEIPVTTYSLSIKAVGNGSATYKNKTVRDDSQTFTVNEGSDVTIAFIPDDGYRIKSVKHDEADVTSNMIDNSYSISDIHADATVEVEFEERVNSLSADGISYQVTSWEAHSLTVVAADDGLVLEIPDKISSQDEEWTVTGIDGNVLDDHEILAAIIWNPEALFTARVTNPNLLLYVKDEQYAPATIKNVVVNGYANSITLTDAQSGNNFYCPRSFTAQSISYSHRYWMKTGINESRGWETIALPFDVQKISHSTKGEITPFANWYDGDSTYPFWLYQLSANGFIEADAIKANTPYIISMPNNDRYSTEYHLNGRVDFTAKNVEVKKSDDIHTSAFIDRTFIPNFVEKQANAGLYALNVNNEYEVYQGGEAEGGRFIRDLRQIHPFEAYMTSSANTRSIGVFDDMTTDIKSIEILTNEETIKVYDLSGRIVRIGTNLEEIKQGLPAGVYIVNHQKMIIK